MQPNKMRAGKSGCERLNEKIAFPLDCVLTKSTTVNKPTIKMTMKIQKMVVETVIVFDVTSFMKMVKVAAKKPTKQMFKHENCRIG